MKALYESARLLLSAICYVNIILAPVIRSKWANSRCFFERTEYNGSNRKIVGFIPQIDENVKTLFEKYLKKPRNLHLAENEVFVNINIRLPRQKKHDMNDTIVSCFLV